MPNKLVRCGLHLELLKFGQQPDPTRPELKDQLSMAGVVEAAERMGITRIGIELPVSESRALFAVQRLLDQTDYRGNIPPTKLPPGNPYFFDTDLPRVSVTVADYLHAYGLKRRKTLRGKQEFNANSRDAALGALRGLANRNVLVAYDRKHATKGQQSVNKTQRVEAVAPLIGLDETQGRLTITPNPILVDQIDSYFMWKPVDLYTQVLDGKDRTKALFVEHLLYLFEMNRREGERAVFVVRRQMGVIAHALRMDSLLNARQDKRIRRRLNGLYDYAKQIGYLKDYSADSPGAKASKIDRLHLNSARFRAMRKVSRQMSQGLPLTVAKSAPNGSSRVDPTNNDKVGMDTFPL